MCIRDSDPCVANRMTNGKQQTMCFHADDMSSSHVHPKVNDDFSAWLNNQCGEHGEASCTRGKKHDCPGMTIELEGNKVLIDVMEHVKGMHEEFPIEFKKGEKAVNPAASDVFSEDASKMSNDAGKALLHRMTAKALFACKWARPTHNQLLQCCVQEQRIQEKAIGAN